MRGRPKGSKNSYRKIDVDINSPVVSDLITTLKGGQAKTEAILEVMHEAYPEFNGVMLRLIKNEINESELDYLIGSDIDGYFLCTKQKDVDDYVRGLRTQAQTMLEHADHAEAKFSRMQGLVLK